MSWGHSTSGTVAEVRATIATWKTKVEQADRAYSGNTEAVIALHGTQVDRVVEEIEHFAASVPEGYSMSVSGGGHAHVSTDGVVASDQWNISVGAYKPASTS